MSELTAERLRNLLHYDPETGVFTWRVTSSNRATAGKQAGSSHNRGCRRIMVDGSVYLAHRLAWVYVHGVWPLDMLDHIDGVKHNNAIRNLRECNSSENQQNRAAPADGSPLLGVTWHKAARAWCARIRVPGRKLYLGLFDTPEAAHAAYLAAKQQLHTFNPVPRTTTTGTSANDSTFTTTPATRRHRA